MTDFDSFAPLSCCRRCWWHGAAVAACLRAQDAGLDLGTRAPSAAVQTLDGKPVDLAR